MQMFGVSPLGMGRWAMRVMIAMCATLLCCGGDASMEAVPTAPVARSFASFRDVPGVTAEEIAAIEAFSAQREAFAYGGVLSTETFLDENGSVGGYTSIVCRWLTELFGIPFTPAIYEWGDLISGLQSLKIDFSGDFTPTDERKQTWFMTDGVSGHAVKAMRIAESEPLAQIKRARAPRYVFLEGSQTAAAAAAGHPFDVAYANGYAEAYAMLKSGKADAFVEDGLVEAAFDSYGDVVSEEFEPFIFNVTAITTLNPKLAPVVSVITKALRNGGAIYLNNLYRSGHDAYLRHKFLLALDAEERAYLKNSDTVPIAYQYFNYPIAFYDFNSGKWDGISIDILREVEKLTGLVFKVINTEHTEMPELIAMLADGRGHMFCDLIYTKERAREFIWNKNTFMADQYALLSKANYPNLNINEVPYMRIAMIKSTAHEEMLLTWFPSAAYAVSYPNSDAAFLALERGEADFVMASKSKLLWYSNYYEFAGYKANLLFNYYYESAFAFNKDQTVLCSVVDKAVSVIETNVITEQWITKTYDFRSRLLAAQAQLPWLIGAICLAALVLALILALLIRSRSEEKRLEKQVAEQTFALKAARDEARSASEAKSRFMANMNHEMRTPMNAIVGLTDLVLEEDEAPPKVKDAIKKISSAGNILMGLISDVLDISKVEAGRLELISVKYDIASILNDVVTLNLIRIQDKPVALVLDINETLPTYLMGDDLRVKQILNNLLSNAFKYTKEGTVTLSAESVRDGDSVWLQFYIRDTGIGIREEDIAKLFTAYSQVDTHANRRVDGTGLGLDITKKFTELMDGKISVESVYGKGTTFSVRIRQGFVSSEVIGKGVVDNLRSFRHLNKRESAREGLVRADLSYARVLVVDDFPTNLDVAARILRKYKMQVDCVDSGQKAIDSVSAKNAAYDAIFMDHMMPGMDGIEATAAIRAIGTEYAKNVPIIALTANAVAGNERMFLENGFNAFLSKPINVVGLDAIVRRWVRDKSKE